MTRIKVCGNTRPEDIDLAVELGVDLLGFIFTSSKRQVHVDQVKAVIARVPDTVERVGVFVDEPPQQIAEVAEACGLTAVQVYRPLTAKDRSLGLDDGRYSLSVIANQVHDGMNQELDGDGDGVAGDNATTAFHRFFGDINGDGTIDGTDFGEFGGRFGLTL